MSADAARDAKPPPQQATPARLSVECDTDRCRLRATGSWTATQLGELAGRMARQLNTIKGRAVTWDLTPIEQIDSAGMMLLLHHRNLLKQRGCNTEVLQTPEQEALEQLVTENLPQTGKTGTPRKVLRPVAGVGRATVGFLLGFQNFLAFLGENAVVLLHSLFHPASLRFGAITRNIEEAGVRALPIITLTSFLIGVVIAYQGAVQLQKFGANIFIVDMIGIAVTRELAPLITAIVVAGRTGSAYTAQLGVMKITEEIDAMRVMGFDPQQFLVVPRIFALMIALPLLIFFADIIGILGGMVVAHLHLGISWGEFVQRLRGVVAVKHYWIGIFKGPFFAWLIAVVGCYRGFQVSHNTESIGHYTTVSVVNSIFLVIACDALFSVVFTQLGI